MRLENNVVVVTGSGSGIGRACALEFAKAGAKVVVADLNLQGANQTVKQIEENVKSAEIQLDAADVAMMREMAEVIDK